MRSPLPDRPRYLRVVVTTDCPLRCAFCHAEGDRADGARGVDSAELQALLGVAARAGIRKFKFLGGEPLVRRDLPELVAATRRAAPDADVSIITSGVGATQRLDAAFAAGLDRANLSIHGWALEAFERRGGTAKRLELRQANLRALLDRGRPLKLNYVWTSEDDRADLSAFLSWAAGHRVVVNLLDDLGDDAASWETLMALLLELRGPPASTWVEPDPDSLPTTRLRWWDGLTVELKTEQVGALGPWRACTFCPVRLRCREGIFAVRLNHRGELQPCMDREDVTLPLRSILRARGPDAALAAWLGFIDGLQPRRAA